MAQEYPSGFPLWVWYLHTSLSQGDSIFSPEALCIAAFFASLWKMITETPVEVGARIRIPLVPSTAANVSAAACCVILMW